MSDSPLTPAAAGPETGAGAAAAAAAVTEAGAQTLEEAMAEAVAEAAVPSPSAPPDAGGAPAGPTGTGRLAALVERLRREIEQAHAEADGRALIEMAKGLLIERLGCGPAEAARQLTRLAGQADVSLLELAADLLGRRSDDTVARIARLTDVPEPGSGGGAGRGVPGRSALPDNGEEDAEAAAEAAPRPGGTGAAVRLRTAESGALAAPSAQAAALSVFQHALKPLGAAALALWATHPDASLSLVGAAGLAEDETRGWHHVPPGVATPARRAVTRRQSVWLDGLAKDGLASVGQRHLGEGTRVAVPARLGGRTFGALEICWPTVLPEQPAAVLRQIEALGELCAHVLETQGGSAAAAVPSLADTYPQALELVDLADGLDAPAVVLVPVLDADGQLADFRMHHANQHFADPAGRPRSSLLGARLLETYPLAAEAGGLFEKAEHVYATGEPFRARLTLTTRVDNLPVTSAARAALSRHGSCVLLVWHVEEGAARLANLLQHAQRLGRIGGFEEDYRTGEATWNDQLFTLYGLPDGAAPVPLAQLGSFAHEDDGPTVERFLRGVLHHRRASSTAFRLQREDGVFRYIRVIAEPLLDPAGNLDGVRGAYQDVSAQHWTEVALAATREQLVHTEQQAAERNRLALQLQRAIMPAADAPRRAAGLEIAVRYRPAEQEHLVGGDWYDCVVLPTGQVLLCVGDVAGHGIDAATGMVALRNALRGLAATGAGPGQLLSWLNAVTHHLTDNVTATVVCALYQPETRALRWARAGHLPPVLVGKDGTAALPLTEGILLGALPEAHYEERTRVLAADETLLLFTDGLIERRDRTAEQAMADLFHHAVHGADLEHLLDDLLALSTSDTDDDTCVLGIRPTVAL